MNEPHTPTPDLESVAHEDGQEKSNAQVSQSVNPASVQSPSTVAPEQPAAPMPAVTTTAAEAPTTSTPSENVQPAAPLEQQAAQTTRGDVRVLIIEDERFISDLYTRALKKEGYIVESENDGMIALERARSGNYDIILLDIMLPSMNGIDLLNALKRGDTPGDTITSKIVITTNMDQPDDVKKRVESIADGYLIKAEITPKELVNFIKQLL